ncbi:hypothetical protein CCR94_18230 [Rhodoblastus sphagnicola]|uniref:Uncharacterized protein n=1 Tax=Rhodoblastus sphagnicola TaxID=333368 RepID=A0A2S6N0T1_9HYPH|nr:hypothetical protein [Rhodoblastus sphagnicola]MBB4200593.1 hypothetical protein [Rhodoblastus sphagnicola]PPQ28237.1 hypothetical protein CCR94_18230 [Rhodoblastus sphagnicola]
MARPISYSVPCADKNGVIRFEPRLGTPIRLYIGNYQHRFAIQVHNSQTSLVHVETGLIVGDVNDAAVRMMCSRGGGAPTDRDAAKWLIDALIAQHGADKINRQIKQKLAEVARYREVAVA